MNYELSAENLVERGLLTTEQAELALQNAKDHGISVSEAATNLGFLIANQPKYGPGGFELFLLRAQYFPMNTKDLLSIDELTRYGALLLGYKRVFRGLRLTRAINIGMIAPQDESQRDSIEKLVHSRAGTNYGGAKFYWILPDQFVSIMQIVFGAEVKLPSTK